MKYIYTCKYVLDSYKNQQSYMKHLLDISKDISVKF